MNKLNLLLSLCIITFFVSCESEFEPFNGEDQTKVKSKTDIPVPVDLCDFPDFPDTCPAPTDPGDPEPTDVPVFRSKRDVATIEIDILYDYAACLDEELNDPNLAPFEYEGEVYEYEENAADPDAILAITAIAMHYIVDLDGGAVAARGRAGGFAVKLLKCLVRVSGITDLHKLLKHYRSGRLTKKMLFRIIKRNLVRKLGWVGAAITFCELLRCMAED